MTFAQEEKRRKKYLKAILDALGEVPIRNLYSSKEPLMAAVLKCGKDQITVDLKSGVVCFAMAHGRANGPRVTFGDDTIEAETVTGPYRCAQGAENVALLLAYWLCDVVQ